MTVRSKHFLWRLPIKRAAGISAAAALTMPLALGGALIAPAPSADAQEYVQEDSDVAVQHPGWESLSTRRDDRVGVELTTNPDRKSTRLNSSHVAISYAVFCLHKQ